MSDESAVPQVPAAETTYETLVRLTGELVSAQAAYTSETDALALGQARPDDACLRTLMLGERVRVLQRAIVLLGGVVSPAA